MGMTAVWEGKPTLRLPSDRTHMQVLTAYLEVHMATGSAADREPTRGLISTLTP
jgi:hypothetical protein